VDDLDRRPARQWRVSPAHRLVKAVGAMAFGVITVFSAMPAGDRGLALLAGIATAVLLVLAVRDVLAPVRLAVDEDGLTVIRGFAGRLHIPWAQVRSIRLDERQRRGRSTRLVEIDTGEQLYLLSSYDLGAPAEDVTEELRNFQFRAGSGTD
jgi:hypothetical protein